MPRKKLEDGASLVYKCFFVHFMIPPSIRPESRDGTDGPFEVNQTLLVWSLHIRNKLFGRSLRPQSIEEPVESETLEKWLHTQVQVDGSRQLRLWQIVYPCPYLVEISNYSIDSLCKSYSGLVAHMQTLGFLYYLFS